MLKRFKSKYVVSLVLVCVLMVTLAVPAFAGVFLGSGANLLRGGTDSFYAYGWATYTQGTYCWADAYVGSVLTGSFSNGASYGYNTVYDTSQYITGWGLWAGVNSGQ